RSSFDSMAAKLQIGIAMVVSTGINLYIAIPEKFSGAFGIQYWYLPATFASIFGIFDKTNLLADSTTADLGYANFVLKGITARFWGLIFLYVFILTVATGFVAYYARKNGCQKGLSVLQKDLDDIHSGKQR
ncbi:MAG: hypothetical protein RR057_03840, partial [Clostridia bacterium]